MSAKTAFPLIGANLLFALISSAGEPAMSTFSSPTITNPQAFPEFDFLTGTFTQTGEMDLDNGPGDLSISKFQLTAFLSEPITLMENLTMIPIFSYNTTQLDFDDVGAAFPIQDEDLHSISLSSVFLKNFQNSPWMVIGYARAEMATDFQAISTDDLTFDLAAGIAYRFSDTFTLGAGFVVTNLNGDDEIFPGINFDWAPCESFRAGIYGANILATYNISDNWHISLDGTPGGGNFNIRDAAGRSRTIQLDSYWVSINTHHRIVGELWFNAGVGYTFANEIEVRGNTGGGPSFSREMDGAPLAQIGLSLHKW